MLKERKLAIVDLETTGATASFHRILEIGILRIEEGRLVDEFSSLVDPECRIPYPIQRLTGIKQRDVKGAPTFRDLQPKVADLLKGCVFVAHNVRFDYGFMRNEFQRLGKPFSPPCLCSVRLSRALYPQFRQHGLSSLIERYQFACENRHRALDDARVVWSFMQHAYEDLKAGTFNKHFNKLLRTPTWPPALKQSTIEKLPSKTGVYIFYDDKGTPLYVGKSTDIRQRVFSHFSGDHRSGKEQKLSQHTHDIELHETAGELGALLLESNLIKTLKPLYNRRGRAAEKLVVLRLEEEPKKYGRIRIETVDLSQPFESGTIMGMFRSKRQAKECLEAVARELKLCLRLLGLEDSDNGPCFNRQLDKCSGACEGKGSVKTYNARLESAFAGRRFKKWPYSGSVIVEEHGSEDGQGDIFVLDQWQLVQAMRYTEQGLIPWLEGPERFDYDDYKLLIKYLAKPQIRVRPLESEELNYLKLSAAGEAAV